MLFDGNGRLTGLPGAECLHLGEGGGVPHPLDRLVVRHNPHVLSLHLTQQKKYEISRLCRAWAYFGLCKVPSTVIDGSLAVFFSNFILL